MSATVRRAVSPPAQDEKPALKAIPSGESYKAFVAGVLPAIAKWSVGHPFDTIKVRLQTAPTSQFKGPLDCVLQTIRNEGSTGFYRGATPPLLGWMITDSLMLGSLMIYRRLLSEHVYRLPQTRSKPVGNTERLPTSGHFFAGMLSGWTVAFVSAPIEHVKARLQVQYQRSKSQRLYSGPIDCVRKLLQQCGLPGLYHGLSSAIIFRTFFATLWGSYDLWTRFFESYTNLSTPATNFWAGGLSAQTFWLTAYPLDLVKQRIMTDSLDPRKRKYWRWRDAARAVYLEAGWRGYWRGFLPCFLRAFPANGVALMAFEGVMRSL